MTELEKENSILKQKLEWLETNFCHVKLTDSMFTNLEDTLSIVRLFDYIKLTVDGKVYFDDTETNPNDTGEEDVWIMEYDIRDQLDKSKLVDTVNIKVVEGDHSIVEIKTK